MKIFLVTAAVIVAFVITELTMRQIIGYPPFNVQSRIKNANESEGGRVYLYKPYAKFWTVEGGNNVYQRNNLGLPGTSIDTAKKMIYVLGTSFVEALQIKPEKIATSVFKNRLRSVSENWEVANLGYCGDSPYESFILFDYFQKRKKAEKVILVVNALYAHLFNKLPKASASSNPIGSFAYDNSGSVKMQLFFRNSSSVFNILTNALKLESPLIPENKDQLYVIPKETTSAADEKEDDNEEFTKGLQDIIVDFHKRFGDNFFLVSIIPAEKTNKILQDFCKENDIGFYHEPIKVPKYQIDGIGHLTEAGNARLGLLLYNSFLENTNRVVH